MTVSTNGLTKVYSETNQVDVLVKYILENTPEEKLLTFLLEYGSVVVPNHTLFAELLNRVKCQQQKQSDKNVLERLLVEEKDDEVVVNLHTDQDLRFQPKYTLTQVLKRLYEEGLNPCPLGGGFDNFTKRNLNDQLFQLGLITFRHSNKTRYPRVTNLAKRLGCKQIQAGVIYSEEAYSKISQYFRNKA